MLPEPLHPALVHFPIVLAFLLPMFAVGALWAIRRGAAPVRAWALPLAFAAVLAGSAWVAVETGEGQEDRVEQVVAEAPLHEHEEAGERFLLLAGVLLLVTAGGLASGTMGAAARYVAIAGSLAVAVSAVDVGMAGGELVYQHGAASAYTATSAGAAGTTPAAPAREHEEEDDD